MRRSIVLIALTLPLAACGASGPSISATNASAAEVKAKIAAAGGAAAMVSPGRWEGTMTINEMKMPLLPLDQQEKMAARSATPKKLVNCITEEDVKANKAFFTGSDDKSCTYETFTMGGGRIDAKMTCGEGGATMKGSMNGTYAPDHYTISIASNMEGAKDNPYGTMSVKMTVDAKRVGACTGTENKE